MWAWRPSASNGEETGERGAAGNPAALKIGYLLSGSALDPVRPVMEQLRQSLLAAPAVAEAMKASGYGDIWLRPSDDPADLTQRIGAEEFDLVFATAVVYARQFRPRSDRPEVFQQAAYEPIFQFRHLTGDIYDQRGNGVFRKGVIFIGPRSPLWKSTPTPEEIRAELERSRIAVADSYSATGYIYPQIKIRAQFPGIKTRGPLFCRSETEVIKHVVSGLAAVGACDMNVLETTLGGKGTEGGKFYQELFTTDRIPADPILLRRNLLPQNSPLPLGTELKVAIQAFFNATPGPAAGLKVEKAERRSFEDMARALAEFDRIEGRAP
ncbi:PhnD/SsuA/transferrin family substrate-binding protein [Candidatus Sumerlaeota bacterium]|nr:PhnD/SsuA/transferrin family substrate-binding protein [Candidatus Sumerlaeota bacterium]